MIQYSTADDTDTNHEEQLLVTSVTKNIVYRPTRTCQYPSLTQFRFKNNIYDEGTINLNMRDPTEFQIIVKYILMHFVGMAMIKQFSLKAVLKLFGPKF